MLVILLLNRLRQEDHHECEVSLDYLLNSWPTEATEEDNSENIFFKIWNKMELF